MLIAGGVYVERCVVPETVQLLGSAGRAAFALSNFRNDLVLHTFHPLKLWEDIRANFIPLGIDCKLYPSNERISFSYLFPLGRPVQTPALSRFVGDQLVEGRDILSFGCVEGRFIVRGDSVVYDPQGSPVANFRKSGCAANRLALILNAQEILTVTGCESVRAAATSLLVDEVAAVAVVKDGPRGAMVFSADGGERLVLPYQSSSLYKIGSGDVFSATFAHWWLQGVDAYEAADRASRQTAAYVEAPVLPLVVASGSRSSRTVRLPENVVLIAARSSLTSRWLVAIVEEALRHLGIAEIYITDLQEWLAGLDTPPPAYTAAALICVGDAELADAARDKAAILWQRHIVFLEGTFAAEKHGRTVFNDLSQAIYELCWDPA